jgi:acyl-coenzyme A synthetase/AMP-(fatty) acid ligase
MRIRPLHSFLDDSVRRYAERIAVVEPGSDAITYKDLAALSDRVRDRLVHLGVRPGDRVGICVRKSIESVACIFGILKAGAAYVPVDPTAPAARGAYIFANCSVKAVIAEKSRGEKLLQTGQLSADVNFTLLDGIGGGHFLSAALNAAQDRDPAPVAETVPALPSDLAYILYTSGSTAKPKGILHTTGGYLTGVSATHYAVFDLKADEVSRVEVVDAPSWWQPPAPLQ